MITKTTTHGHVVSYDDKSSQGLRYISLELDDSEAKVFFDQAYEHGSAIFEDHMGLKYKLTHSGGEYQLTHI